MKSTVVSVVLLLGMIVGALVSPLFAQAPDAGDSRCFAGQGSSAACSGRWIFFAGNTANLDESAWVVRIDGETGEIWFKNGRRLQRLEESE